MEERLMIGDPMGEPSVPPAMEESIRDRVFRTGGRMQGRSYAQRQEAKAAVRERALGITTGGGHKLSPEERRARRLKNLKRRRRRADTKHKRKHGRKSW